MRSPDYLACMVNYYSRDAIFNAISNGHSKSQFIAVKTSIFIYLGYIKVFRLLRKCFFNVLHSL